MKIFGFNIERRNKEKNNKEYITPYNDSLNFTYLRNKWNSLNLSAVFRAVDLISDNIAMLPLKVKINNNGCKEEINDHNIYYALENGLLTKFTIIKRMVQDMLLKGNGFAYIERNVDGSVKSINYIPASDVVIHYDKQKSNLFYNVNGMGKKIEPINIIHLVKYSYDGINGISVLNFASRTINVSNATENAANKFFEGGCNLAGILKVQGQLSDKQRGDIRASWNSAYTDGGSGVAILQGNMDYTPIQLSAKEAQLLDSRQYNIQDIARFFGINPVLLGDLSHSSYSTIEAAQNEFVLHTLQPYITLIEQELTRKLILPSENGMSINLDEKYLLRADKTAESSYYAAMVTNGIMCINEVRKQLGLNEIEGGDKHIIPYSDINQNEIKNGERDKKDK